jgi:hypothetical protein
MTLSILLRFHHGPSKAPSQTQEKNGLARRLTLHSIDAEQVEAIASGSRAESQVNDDVILKRQDKKNEDAVGKRVEPASEVRPTEVLNELQTLAESIQDLEQRGLLQYSAYSKEYTIHPVVRGMSLAAMSLQEKNLFGKEVVKLFATLSPKDE